MSTQQTPATSTTSNNNNNNNNENKGSSTNTPKKNSSNTNYHYIYVIDFKRGNKNHFGVVARVGYVDAQKKEAQSKMKSVCNNTQKVVARDCDGVLFCVDPAHGEEIEEKRKCTHAYMHTRDTRTSDARDKFILTTPTHHN